MRTGYDFSPLYRSTVGFDRLFDLLDQAAHVEPTTNWPPYNLNLLRVGLSACDARCTFVQLRFSANTPSARYGFSRIPKRRGFA